jgi:hypothetical protein
MTTASKSHPKEWRRRSFRQQPSAAERTVRRLAHEESPASPQEPSRQALSPFWASRMMAR